MRTAALILVLMLPVMSAALGGEAAPSLLPNGNFESAAKDAPWPEGWPHPEGASWGEEDGNHFLRLRAEKPGQTVLVYLAVPMKPECQALELRYRVRYADIKPGKGSWYDGRVMMNFKDDSKQVLAPGPEHPSFRGSSKGWEDRTQYFTVPPGAKFLEIMPTLWQAESGTLDFDDFRLVPVAPRPKPPAPAPVVAPPSVPVVPADPALLAPVLHVEGNHLKTPDGKAVWLQGLAIASMEWTEAGEHLRESIPVAIDAWKSNVVRLPVSDEFWFGRGQWQKDGGAAYRKLVDAAVEAVATRKAYLVLDLHRFGAPMDEHVEFWKDAATRYKDHPAVLYELFNEAHTISWDVWQNGGELKPAADAEKAKRPRSPGMQALLDAVRGTGAKNVVVAGGLDWGYDLSGVVEGHALDDRGGHGIVYSSHIYPWKRDWAGKVLAAAEKYPLFIGEVGCPPERFSFIPPELHEDPYTWAPDVLGLIQKHKLHWTAWCFHPTAAPMVICDWQYTPTPYWGAFVKDALGGKAFEMKKMR